MKHPSKLLEVGQEEECQVLEVAAQATHISLGLTQPEPDPWELFTEKYQPGDRIEGKIRSITDYGVFVGIEEGVDGMVHKTDLSWTVRLNNPSDPYNKGQTLSAIILSINHDEKKVSLGVKQLWDDPWGTLLDSYKPGTVVDGAEVLSVAEYGAFVRVAEGIDGLIPTGEVPANTTLARGERVKAEISNVDSVDRRITLTMRNPGESQEAEQLQVLKREQTGKGATLGDLLKDKLGAIKTSPASVPPPAPEPAADGDDDDDDEQA